MLDSLRSTHLPQTVGEMEYQSNVSRRTEYLPIAVSLMGPPGTISKNFYAWMC
jgi:hypothetical protein